MRWPQRTRDPIPELKRRAAERIVAHLAGLTVLEAALALNIEPRRVGDIRAGRLARFSFEMMLKLLTQLRLRVEVLVDDEPL